MRGGGYYFTKHLPEKKSLEFISQNLTKKGTLGTRISPEIIAVKHIHNGEWSVVQWRLPKKKKDYFENNVRMSEYISEMMVNSKYIVFYPQTYYVKAESHEITTKKYELEIYDIQGNMIKKLPTVDIMKAFKQADIKPKSLEKVRTFLEVENMLRLPIIKKIQYL